MSVLRTMHLTHSLIPRQNGHCTYRRSSGLHRHTHTQGISSLGLRGKQQGTAPAPGPAHLEHATHSALNRVTERQPPRHAKMNLEKKAHYIYYLFKEGTETKGEGKEQEVGVSCVPPTWARQPGGCASRPHGSKKLPPYWEQEAQAGTARAQTQTQRERAGNQLECYCNCVRNKGIS